MKQPLVCIDSVDRYGYDLNLQSKSMELLARPDIPFRYASSLHSNFYMERLHLVFALLL